MVERKTQLDRIVALLERDGRISRNACLSMFISRLAARIADLEEDGWVFKTEKVGGDFVYRVVERPKARQLTLV
jgi:Helix-turn-helix domain